VRPSRLGPIRSIGVRPWCLAVRVRARACRNADTASPTPCQGTRLSDTSGFAGLATAGSLLVIEIDSRCLTIFRLDSETVRYLDDSGTGPGQNLPSRALAWLCPVPGLRRGKTRNIFSVLDSCNKRFGFF
jgi:hypothetical protein